MTPDFLFGFGSGCIASVLIQVVVTAIVNVRIKRHNDRIDRALEGLNRLDINAP